MIPISIIMPLYNASKYLEDCLQSVLNQTFTEFELICINDASTDVTMEILYAFQHKDSRIRILANTERMGAAYSRNRGMSVANGEYVTFLDGDDIFDERMLEKAYSTIEEKEADIVVYDFKRVLSEVIYNKICLPRTKEYRDRYRAEPFALSDYEPYEVQQFPLGPWNKLYRRKLIEENQIFFQNLPCGNDLYFVLMSLMLSKRTVMLDDDDVMVYVRNHAEASRISLNRDSMCIYKAVMKVGQGLTQRQIFDKLYAHFYYSAFYSLRDAFPVDNNRERAKVVYNFLQNEGIEHLRSLNRQCYENLDEYIKSRFEQFEKQSFESAWYMEENILKLFLHKKSEKVIALYNKYKADKKKIAVWGAGENGKTLLEFCWRHNLDVEAVIDKAEEKQGKELLGYHILALPEVLNKIQVIIISARFIYDDVVKEVRNRNEDIEVIDINQFLCIN